MYRRERELHDFVENATEGLHWTGADGVILWANKADYGLLGYTRDEYIGHHLAEFHAEPEVVDDMLARLLRNECFGTTKRACGVRMVDQTRRRQFKRALEGRPVHSQPVFHSRRHQPQACGGGADPGGNGAARFGGQLRRASLLLEEAVHAREEFLSTAAHELRNPVNALQLQLVALQRATQDREAVQREWAGERVGQAVEAVRRLVRLVETLLDASRIAAGRLDLDPEPLDFGQAVHAVASRFRDQLKDRQLITRLTRATGTWDRVHVEQIVTNLLSNAIKYGEGLPIEILLEADDSTVCVSVTDHGIGIEPKTRSGYSRGSSGR